MNARQRKESQGRIFHHYLRKRISNEYLRSFHPFAGVEPIQHALRNQQMIQKFAQQ
jgi:hypothetical protein